MEPFLRVLSGDDAGLEMNIRSDELIAGRDPTSGLVIKDPNFSRRHFRILREDLDWFIEDLRSHNGTRLNGNRITVREKLGDGDRLAAGDTEIAFLLNPNTEIVSRILLDDSPLTPPDTFTFEPTTVQSAALVKLLRSLRKTRNANDIQDRCLSAIFEMTPADRAAILFRAADGETFLDCSGRDRRNTRKDIRVSQTIVNRVMDDGAVMATNDLHAAGIDSVESLRTAKVRAFICIPVDIQNGPAGAIYADTADPAGRFDKTHIELLMSIAAIAGLALENALYVRTLEIESEDLKEQLQIEHEMIGNSPATAAVIELIAQCGPTLATVLVEGESGTGKELVARALHRNSRRAKGPFVAINCAALPADLIESELFGYEKGAFSGAIAQKPGKIELASGGTLFLDEIGEMPMSLQAKLLRVIQERECERLGGTKPIKVDIRIVVATNRNLAAEVAKGTFRQDLFHRISVIPIKVPALAERPTDIPLLVTHFLRKFRKQVRRGPRRVHPDAMTVLQNYPWPGNIRELQNLIERLVILCRNEEIQAEDLPQQLREAKPKNLEEMMYRQERDHVWNTYLANNKDKDATAKALGYERKSLTKLFQRLNLTLDP